MQLVSAAAPEIFSDALALRSPNATLIGQALSPGGLPACPWPASTNPAAPAPPKAGLRPAAGKTAPPEARQCQKPGTIRRPRAPATSPRVKLFDSPRRNAYAQSARARAAHEIAPTPARPAVSLRVTPSAIRDEPTLGNQSVGLPRARASSARIDHSNSPRRNPYAQRTRPLAPHDAASTTARRAAGLLETPAAVRDEPAIGNPTTDRPHAPATAARLGHFDPARRNPYAQRTRTLEPDDAASTTARHTAGPRKTPATIRDEPTARIQTTDRRRAPANAARLGHFDPACRNPYAQRTPPSAPDDAASAPARSAVGPRVAPSAIRDEPAVGNQTPGPSPRPRNFRSDWAFRFCPPQPVHPEDRLTSTEQGLAG
jgi:hypothetical protein